MQEKIGKVCIGRLSGRQKNKIFREGEGQIEVVNNGVTSSDDFIYDMKYATNDNFLKSNVYDCAECFLRLKTVKALIMANDKFIKKGYKIKLFDCYRPLDIQKKMWALVPNPEYVADPAKGSIHNREELQI